MPWFGGHTVRQEVWDFYEDDALVCKWYFNLYSYNAQNLKLKVRLELPSEATEVFGDSKMVLLSRRPEPRLTIPRCPILSAVTSGTGFSPYTRSLATT